MKFGEKLVRFLPRSKNTPEEKIMAYFSLFAVVFILVAIVISFIVFGITLKGRPVVSVPALTGMELVVAMEDLQNYGLTAEVHQRISKEKLKRGIVFSQHPRSGANVKMGGKVILSVSRGMNEVVLNNFVGNLVDDVENSVERTNDSVGDSDFISLNITRVYHSLPLNEVISQTPEAGTKIEKPTEVTLEVSAGRWEQTVLVPNLIGKSFKDAIKILSAQNIPFNFRYKKNSRVKETGSVLSQTPEKGSKIKLDSFVDLSISGLPSKEGMVFGVYDKVLPVYKVPLVLRVYLKLPKEEDEIYFQLKHPGGNVSFPYYVVEGSLFTIEVENNEIDNFIVK